MYALRDPSGDRKSDDYFIGTLFPVARREEPVAPWLGTEGQAAFYRQWAQADDKYTRAVEARFETIRVPTLLLWGVEDRWIPVDRGYRLADIIPGARLSVVPEAGHLVIEERPEALLEEIWSFLS